MGQFIDRDSDGDVLLGCSLCGMVAFYPSEMRYTTERLFYCWRHRDTTTRTDEARKAGRVPTEPISGGFRGGVKPDWYP